MPETQAAAAAEDRTARDPANLVAKPAAEGTTTPAQAGTPASPATTPEASELDELLLKPAEPAAPKPGTPDKAIQKVQQDVSALHRTMAAIQDQLSRGDELDPADKQRLVERREKAIQSLRDAGMDEAAYELAGIQGSLSKLSKLEQENAELRGSVEETNAAVNWMRAEIKYPHTNVRKVWDKACDDAEEAAKTKLSAVWGTFNDQQKAAAVAGEAQSLFGERCAAVEARAANINKGPTPTAASAPAATTAAGTVTTTAGAGTKVTASTMGSGPGDISATQQQLERARRLVKRDN